MSNNGDHLTQKPDFGLTKYQADVREYLRTDRTELWEWFSTQQQRDEASDATRLNLLKTAYRLDADSTGDEAARLYAECHKLAERMGMTVPITLYQAQQTESLNAALCWTPDQMQIVFSGRVRELLDPAELTTLLAHEMAHFELLTADKGTFGITEEVLTAALHDRCATGVHDRTWRSFKLYTELHCDRRAVQLTEDPDACIRTLVKMGTGIADVSNEAFMKQTEEILEQDKAASEGWTHPEIYIRAKAVHLWLQSPELAEPQIRALIEGPLTLSTLDLLQQRRVTAITLHFIQSFLHPRWLQTPVLLGYARRFDEHFIPADSADFVEITRFLDASDADIRKYFCFLLLDFATCDPDLEDTALAAGFVMALRCGLQAEFRDLAAKELKLGKRARQTIEKTAEETVQRARKEFNR